MWTTVLVLAVALNLEPNRLALIALMLVRPHPIRQLLAFLAGSFLTSMTAGLLILLALHRGAWVGATGNGAKAQIVIGALALGLALLLTTNLFPKLLGDPEAAQSGQTSLAAKLSAVVGRLVRGSSPWFSAALGVGIAVPSVDYIALLVLIAASGAGYAGQAGVLLTFLTVANTILLVPIVGHLIDPVRTTRVLERLRDWVLSRRRRDYALLLGLIGCIMIAMGIRGL